MSKEMNWDNFVPTREIREYDRKLGNVDKNSWWNRI